MFRIFLYIRVIKLPILSIYFVTLTKSAIQIKTDQRGSTINLNFTKTFTASVAFEISTKSKINKSVKYHALVWGHLGSKSKGHGHNVVNDVTGKSFIQQGIPNMNSVLQHRSKVVYSASLQTDVQTSRSKTDLQNSLQFFNSGHQ